MVLEAIPGRPGHILAQTEEFCGQRDHFSRGIPELSLRQLRKKYSGQRTFSRMIRGLLLRESLLGVMILMLWDFFLQATSKIFPDMGVI